MTTYVQDFELVPNNVAPSPSNTNGAGQTPISSIIAQGGSTVLGSTSSPIDGTTSVVYNGVSGQGVRVIQPLPGNGSGVGVSIKFQPLTSNGLCSMVGIRTSSARVASVFQESDNRISLASQTSTRYTTPLPMVNGNTYYIDVHADTGTDSTTGKMRFAVFDVNGMFACGMTGYQEFFGQNNGGGTGNPTLLYIGPAGTEAFVRSAKIDTIRVEDSYRSALPSNFRVPPSIRNNAVYNANTTGLTLGIAIPDSRTLAVGDVLIAMLACQDTPTTNANAFSAPGWTAISPGGSRGGGTRVQDVLYKVIDSQATLTALAGTTVTFTRSNAQSSAQRNVGAIFSVQNLDPAAPFDSVAPWTASSTGSQLTLNGTSGNGTGYVTKALGLVLAVFNTNAGANVASVPFTWNSGQAVMTEAGHWQSPFGTADATVSASRTALFAWSRVAPAPVTLADHTFNAPASGTQKGGALYTFNAKPVVALVPTPGITLWNGTTETPAKLSVFDGTTEKTIDSWAMAPGNIGLAEMTRKPKFYVAHRGGSKSFPEMTAEAYRRSGSVYGMDALEMSVHRSSDGVFVLAHDADLNRVVGSSNIIAQMTWAQLSALTVKSTTTDNSAQPNEPLARLTDVLPLWIDKRVIFLEDKTYNTTNRNDLLNYIANFAGYQDRVVWKVAGNAGNLSANAGRLAGLKSWGYFFSGGDMQDANFTANAKRFDFIGVDAAGGGTGFSAAEWAQAEATGVPMIAHIVATQAQLDIANSHPIVGVMLANVRELLPRG